MELIVQWCADAWKAIPEALIVASFEQCGLTNATDGSEDDLISAFKDGHTCAAGRCLLREQQVAFINAGLEAEAPETGAEEHAVEESNDEN